MTLPTLVEQIRCAGVLHAGQRCNKLLATGAVIAGSLTLSCPKCGKKTTVVK